MNSFLVIALSLVGGLAVGLVVAVVALRLVGQRQNQLHHDAVEAAVRATLGERGATAEALERDRAQTVQAAVERASEVADAKLDARLRQGSEQLNAGTRAFEKQAADINAELRRMQTMVGELQQKAAGQHGEVVKSLEEAAKVTMQLQHTTGGLKEALASSRSRGQWGERMAEDVLRSAGFVEGVNYHKQKSVDTGGVPDFSFPMPKDMTLHMDVKFPIDNYLRHLEAVEAGDAASADKHKTQFTRDAKAKVTELADRGYADGADSLDYVVLFVPNEGVYAFMHEHSADLIDIALESKIVMCGPGTLFGVLAVVRQAMDNFMIEKRGEEIMTVLADFGAEWRKFSKHVDKLGKQLGTVQRTYDELDGARTNQLNRKLDRIEQIQTGSDAFVADPAPQQQAVGPIELLDEAEDSDAEWPPLREVSSA